MGNKKKKNKELKSKQNNKQMWWPIMMLATKIMFSNSRSKLSIHVNEARLMNDIFLYYAPTG